MDKQYNRNRSTTMNQKQDIKSLKLDRSSLKIKENEFAEYKNEIYKISSIINFTTQKIKNSKVKANIFQ